MLSKYTIAALDADGIGTTQTPAASGVQSLVLDGALTSTNPASGVSEWIADAPRVISITSAGNDSGRTFTVTGISDGAAATEEITGANIGVAAGTTVFSKITGITTDDDTAGAITIGTSNAVTTPWYPVCRYANPTSIALGVTLTGATATYTVQHTLDNVQDSSVTPDAFSHETLVSKTATADGNYAFPITATRIVITAFTAGTVEFVISQAGIGQR